MNKWLKKYAEKQLAQFCNEDFLVELKNHQREKKDRNHFFNKKYVSLYVSLSAVVVIVTVVLLCVFLIKPATMDTKNESQVPLQIEPVNEKKYLGENRISVDSNLSEINDSLEYFSFVDGERISKYIDVQYDEILYYYLICESEDGLYSFNFRVFINPNYQSDEIEIEYDKEGAVSSHKIQYAEKVNCEDDIYFFTEVGEITTDQEIILISAEIIGFEEDSNFIELLNEIIQAK